MVVRLRVWMMTRLTDELKRGPEPVARDAVAGVVLARQQYRRRYRVFVAREPRDSML
jgi:hypothetical protein